MNIRPRETEPRYLFGRWYVWRWVEGQGWCLYRANPADFSDDFRRRYVRGEMRA